MNKKYDENAYRRSHISIFITSYETYPWSIVFYKRKTIIVIGGWILWLSFSGAQKRSLQCQIRE